MVLSGILLSTALLVLTLIEKGYDLGELSQNHRQASIDLWIIREKCLTLITDLRMGEKPIETLQSERNDLLEKLHAVYSDAPNTANEAYKKTQEALRQLEDMTFSDTEIDTFSRQALRGIHTNPFALILL